MDLKAMQKTLAEHKVYDAWQYIESLSETLSYMSISKELIEKTYEHRLKTISETAQELISTAINEGKASFGEKELQKTNFYINGYLIDDSMFLRKTTLEFFHYARISMDVLFQIINAAILGDQAVGVTERTFLRQVIQHLDIKQEFQELKDLLSMNKEDDTFKYLQAFDNYNKHIKTILITVKNSFILGNTDTFLINEFVYDDHIYPSANALSKVAEIDNYVMQTVTNVLSEVKKQVPNCLDNRKRVQSLNFRLIVKEKEESNSIDYMSFFIDVENDIKELPTEIKVYPLIIKPNDEIYSFDFRFDTIFIKKRGLGEESVIGCAKLKNGFSTNEFYRVFEIHECDFSEYIMYIHHFKNNYSNISFNIHAMVGEVLFIKD